MLGETYHYRERLLYCEDVPLDSIADRAGTPCYVYSRASIEQRFDAYETAFASHPHLVCYAVKANSNLAILSLLAQRGAGFDIVSGGELYRVLRAGGDPAKVVFSGVGKTRAEIDQALEARIGCFNCESEGELALLAACAQRLGLRAPVAIRVNPNVEAGTHHHITTGKYENKFGVAIEDAPALYRQAADLPSIDVQGIACHIGSLLLDIERIAEAATAVTALARQLRSEGIPIRHLDFGGGLGVAYRQEEIEPAASDLVHRLCEIGAGYEIHIEPGRSIVAPGGVLLTRVLYRKSTPAKEFVIVDAAMNDLIRPVLYEAHHDILPVRESPLPPITADIVGPVCESGDFLAQNREVANLLPGDLAAVCTAGAYGFVQASNYNSRPRPAEVLVSGSTWTTIRARESHEDLIRDEQIPNSIS